MNINLNNKLAKEKFIKEGHIFKITSIFDDATITILSYVKLQYDIYKLYIKGEYPKGSTSIITLGNIDSSLDLMLTIAIKCIYKVGPIMIKKDYPESLKKIAKENESK